MIEARATEGPVRPDLRALSARLPARFLTRFAPSPTGVLHVGHLVNAIYVWGLARALGGRVLLRLEDHDRTRCRREYERAILNDLEWLGLEPDLGTVDHFRTGPSPWRQSDAGDAYVEALASLRARAVVFACGCSRKDIAQHSGPPHGHEVPYPGTCRTRGLDEAPGRSLRVVVTGGDEAFVDAMLGECRQDPASQCGDLLLRDRHGHWTYQFAVVVDDMRHEVDLVVRGLDLVESTGRQIRLARLLGRDSPPVFCHHGLLVTGEGRKLSKSSRDAGVDELRVKGWAPDAVLGLAAHAARLQTEPRPIAARDLARLFA